MTNNQGSISIKGIIIILSLFLIASLFIVLGLFFSYKNNPEKILNETLTSISNTTQIFLNQEENIRLNKNYTIETSIKSTSKIDKTNEDIKSYLTLLDSIQTINTNLLVSQDKDNSKLFCSITSKKNNEKYINLKYLVKDSTGYYYNDSIKDKYVNLGTNNYFETLSKGKTTKENNNYLNSFIINSLSKNISKNYAKSKEDKIEFNNNEEYAHILSIELDNNKLNQLYKNVINDLKNDKESLFILENSYHGFKDKKIKKKKFLDNNENLYINIYTKGITNKLLKIEIIDIKENNKNIIEYKKIDNSLSYLDYISNNSIKYKTIIKKKKINQYDIDIKNSKNKEIGKIIFKKTTKETIFDLIANKNNKRLNINYRLNINDLKSNRYRENIKLDVKYLVNNNNVVTQSIEIVNKIDNKSNIKEDTSESILEKALTQEEKEKKDTYIDNKFKEIMGDLYGKEKN